MEKKKCYTKAELKFLSWETESVLTASGDVPWTDKWTVEDPFGDSSTGNN